MLDYEGIEIHGLLQGTRSKTLHFQNVNQFLQLGNKVGGIKTDALKGRGNGEYVYKS